MVTTCFLQAALSSLSFSLLKISSAVRALPPWVYRLHFQSAFGEGDILLNQVRRIKRCESTETTPSPQQTKRLNPNV
jgi:hypothetical protein